MSRDFARNDSTPSSPESPRSPDTLKSITAFARFEFEFGRGNDGTKILMVEFEDDDIGRDPSGKWQVSWSGKTTVLRADEHTSENNRRLYFLLPPGVRIPPKIVLSFSPPQYSAASHPQRLTLNPLPAIFAPDLGTTARTSGKKGVLHTIWAKKRLQVLEKEIKREEQFNLEGIALDLARSEKEWIEDNFGVTSQRRPTLDMGSLPKYSSGQNPGLTTPRTPGGRKLSDKLKGLSLGTSDKDLMRKDTANTPSHDLHPLSPDGDDVAYSSFQSFRNISSAAPSTGTSRIKAQFPPDSVKQQQSKSPASMDHVPQQANREPADDLFAKSLSPRSPDDPKSPFSFSSAETIPYAIVKGER